MYRRYNSNPPRGKPPGDASRHGFQNMPPESPHRTEPVQGGVGREYYMPPKPEPHDDKRDSDGLLGTMLNMIPTEIYNRKTKKLFGLLTAEDLLLAALILIAADSDNTDDTALLLALLYIIAA